MGDRCIVPDSTVMDQSLFDSEPVPKLAVVIATRDGFGTIRRTVEHLRAQTVRREMELLIVAPNRELLGLDPQAVDGFARCQVVEVGTIDQIGAANAAGIRSASAPVVVLAEDHCFPEPDWAGQLIEAHQQDWAAVGPAIRNANPATTVSWADLFIGYGPWLEPVPSGEADFLPGHNSSYKRHLLLPYGDRLATLLAAETVLHWDLRAKGFRLFLEPRARVAHTNFSRWSSWIPVQYLCGRSFAGTRAVDMSALRRAVYAVGSPAIPLVRLARLARGIKASGLRRRFLKTLPATAVGLIVDGIGQFVGYLAGPGSAPSALARYEFRRIDHITAEDRRTVFGQ